MLVGLTLGFATPNRVGDYAGRIIELKSRRVSALGAVFLGRYCQLVATVLAGRGGPAVFPVDVLLERLPGGRAGRGGLGAGAGRGWCWCRCTARGCCWRRWALWRPLRRFRPALAMMPTYPARALHAVLAISGLRYAVFCAQFMLLLAAYGVGGAAGAGRWPPWRARFC